MPDRVLMTGNDAVGEGAIRAACDCYFGYPITPQNELTAYMAKNMPDNGRVFVQAESELAAVNMVFGAASAGKRAMTSSSSPGISLKQEGISYLAGAELPAVIVNIQRGGPGLGNIAPSQADYFQATKGGGHGDYHLIVLAPDSVQEMHDLTIEAFALADKYRNPAMVLSDGRLGQMMEPLVLHEGEPPTIPSKPWALTGCANREPNLIRSLYLVEGELETLNIKIQKKYSEIVKNEVRYETKSTDDCDILLVAYGTSARICSAAMSNLRKKGIKAGLLRPVSLWPFPKEAVADFAGRAGKVLVVEMSAGQLLEDVKLAVNGSVPVDFFGRMGGGVPTTAQVEEKIAEVAEGTGARGSRGRAAG
jgi:2-oxoglutarate ferredoxin oxidoreductase subunit alpha